MTTCKICSTKYDGDVCPTCGWNEVILPEQAPGRLKDIERERINHMSDVYGQVSSLSREVKHLQRTLMFPFMWPSGVPRDSPIQASGVSPVAIDDLQSQIDELKAANDSLSAANAQLTDDLSSCRSLMQVSESARITLANTLDKAKLKIQALDNEISDLKTERDSLIEYRDSLQARNVDLEGKLNTVRFAIAKLNDAIR